MTLLWHIIKPDQQAAIRRYMPPGWKPPTISHSHIETKVKLESTEEVAKIMSKAPASKKELDAD